MTGLARTFGAKHAPLILSALALVPAAARAVEVGISAEKLVIVDKLATRGTARVGFVSRDPSIDKGPAGEPAGLTGSLEVFYADHPGNDAVFALPDPWAKNADAIAKYVNRSAPAGGGVRVATLRPGRLAKIVARSLGDDQTIDVLSAPPGPSGLTVVLTIANAHDGSVIRMCTSFPSSSIETRQIANGTGRRLVAREGTPTGCGTTVLMQAGQPEGFFSMPWPNDIRVRADGSIDLAGWPGTAVNPLLALVLDRGSAVTGGFGTNAATYLQTSGGVDGATLPAADESVGAGSPLMLAPLDEPSAPRIPVLADFRDAPTSFRPGNLLTLLPYPGHPLEGRTRYAAIVFDGVRDAQGLPLRPSPLLRALDEPWDPSRPVGAAAWAALRAQRDAVFAYVEQRTDWTPEQVVAFTVFTTQDVSAEMDAIAAAIVDLPAPAPVSRSPGSCPPGAAQTTVFGQIDLPKWQAGPYPFLESGGGIVVVGGKAVQQATERVAFEMTFPCGPAPANGWPILLFVDGTGAFANSAFISELGSSLLPYVVASIAPLYSGDRTVPGQPAELVFFNYLNPLAGRTNQLQQAADVIYLRRVVAGIVLSAAETGNAAPVETDDALTVIAGHSQGALTIPQALAVAPDIDAGFLSAGGGGFYHSLLHRGDVRSLVESLLGTQPGELDMFHPFVHALQTLAEIGDAANYASRVENAHLVLVGGLKDGCSPIEVIAHLGTALGLEVANPLHHPAFGSAALEAPTTSLPAMANLADGRTALTVQLDTGHFGASTNGAIGRTFVESLALGGAPTVAPGPLAADAFPGCSGRFDPLP